MGEGRENDNGTEDRTHAQSRHPTRYVALTFTCRNAVTNNLILSDPSYTQIIPYDWEEHELEHDGKISDTYAHPSMIGRVATKMIRSVVPDWVFNVLHKLWRPEEEAPTIYDQRLSLQ